MPAQLNPYVIFNRGSRPRTILQDSRIGQLSSYGLNIAGSGVLLAHMADGNYLEKLLAVFLELEKADYPGYNKEKSHGTTVFLHQV